MKNEHCIKPLCECNALCQARIAVVLMAVIPVLSFYYLSMRLHGGGVVHDEWLFIGDMFIASCTLLAASAGFLILWKYPRNIVNLRELITELLEGTVEGEVHLEKSEQCDDLTFIERGLNIILEQIAEQLRAIEAEYKIELELRKNIEKQQETLLEAERQRAMVMSIGAACHHLGQPLTILRMRLRILKNRAKSEEEAREIERSIGDLDDICNVLKRLREANEFRTEPYISGIECPDQQVLAI